MKKVALSIVSILMLLTIVACSEDDNTVDEYANWQSRNASFFEQKMNLAKDSIRMAKQLYGDNWEEHCNWRTFLSYTKLPEFEADLNDSICVQILQRGSDEKTPYFTDSVRINYRGYLIPTTSNPEGYVFDHTGYYANFDQVFNTEGAGMVMLSIQSVVKGFSTALINMHKNDLWRIYIPSNLGYESASTSSIPAYSLLTFEVKLLNFYHAGEQPEPWSARKK